jgi:hypothetical protein
MRKIFLTGLYGFLLLALLGGTVHAELTSLSEGFDDVTTLPGADRVITNSSSPKGNHDWGQGIPLIPPGQTDALGANAQSGAPNSFIQTDFMAGIAGSGAVVSGGMSLMPPSYLKLIFAGGLDPHDASVIYSCKSLSIERD